VKDSAGNALAADAMWSFTTVGDTAAPTVTVVSPVNAAVGVSGTANVKATFSKAIDPSTINAITFELRDPANALVAGVLSLSSTAKTATLNPTPTLSPGAVYTATLKGGATDPRVKDTAGNALLADMSWSFTIAGDAIAPTATALSPANGAVDVPKYSNIAATFSEPMDPISIGADSFELRDAADALVPAVVSYSESNRKATLNPVATLGALATYTVKLKGGATGLSVKDSAGNALAGDVIWSFTTQ